MKTCILLAYFAYFLHIFFAYFAYWFQSWLHIMHILHTVWHSLHIILHVVWHILHIDFYYVSCIFCISNSILVAYYFAYYFAFFAYCQLRTLCIFCAYFAYCLHIIMLILPIEWHAYHDCAYFAYNFSYLIHIILHIILHIPPKGRKQMMHRAVVQYFPGKSAKYPATFKTIVSSGCDSLRQTNAK